MSILNNLHKYTVKVCKGSGCIFIPFGKDYMYVLTAKHVIQGKGKVEIFKQWLILNDVMNEKLEIIGEPYLHPENDAAIIKIKPVEGLEPILRLDDMFTTQDGYLLIGHPGTRKNNAFSYRSNRLTIENSKDNGKIEASLENNCTKQEVDGQSGGGIVKISEDFIWLAGIQMQMAAGEDETLGRIDFIPLNIFDEIVQQNREDLVELLPPHLGCFSHLKTQILELSGCFVENNIAFTREVLRNKTDEIVRSGLTPNAIREFFKERLLVYNQSKDNLSDKGLWIAWLEYLIIMNIIQRQTKNTLDIEEIFDSYRLIYSNTRSDWTREMQNILLSDYRGLKEGAKVIVGTNSIPEQTTIPEGIITDITLNHNITGKHFQIDEGIIHPLKKFKFFHIHAFQRETITEKEAEYRNFTVMNETELIEKLKQEYESLLGE